MWSSIVVGTDGSATAAEAVRRAAGLASLCGSRLTVCHAYQPLSTSATLAISGAGAGSGVLFDSADDLDRQRVDAEQLVEQAVMSCGADRARTSGAAVVGPPAEALLRVAEQVEADLLVVGSRGMRGAKRLLGSVPNTITHTAPCAVLVVRTC